MSETLTDTTKRALLRGEVKKLESSGMDYTEAFRTATEAHPEWQATGEHGLPVGRAAQRGGAQMVNDGSVGDADRSAAIQKLVAEYMRVYPGVAYDTAFRAVLSDPANKALADSLHRPGKTPGNMLGKFGSGAGHTPPSKYPQGQGVPGTAETPVDRAEHCTG